MPPNSTAQRHNPHSEPSASTCISSATHILIKDISKENKNLIISEKLGRNGLYLPTGRHITPKLQKKIVKILLEKLREI